MRRCPECVSRPSAPPPSCVACGLCEGRWITPPRSPADSAKTARMSYQNALITGASSGLGRGLAIWFAKKGVTVYAAARRAAELEKLRDECTQLSGKIIPMSLDVSNGDATFDRVQKLDDECGGLALVVANAGVAGEPYGKRIDWPTIKRMIDVNVAGAAATLTGPLSAMVKRGKGQLVGVSSLAAFNGLPRMASYCASKAYLAT